MRLGPRVAMLGRNEWCGAAKWPPPPPKKPRAETATGAKAINPRVAKVAIARALRDIVHPRADRPRFGLVARSRLGVQRGMPNCIIRLVRWTISPRVWRLQGSGPGARPKTENPGKPGFSSIDLIGPRLTSRAGRLRPGPSAPRGWPSPSP